MDNSILKHVAKNLREIRRISESIVIIDKEMMNDSLYLHWCRRYDRLCDFFIDWVAEGYLLTMSLSEYLSELQSLKDEMKKWES